MSLKAALAEAVTPKRKPLGIERIYATLDDEDKAALREAIEDPSIGPTHIANALSAEGHHVGVGMVKAMRALIRRGEHSWEL